MSDVPRDEITPEFVYINRRQFMKGALLTGAAFVLAACGAPMSGAAQPTPDAPAIPPSVKLPAELAHADPFVSAKTDELGAVVNPYNQVTNYNNYYEFSLNKEDVAERAKGFQPLPWNVEVGGMVAKPRSFSMEEIYSTFPHEERIYRLRCVEGWSFVIPWVGFPLASLLKMVEPTPQAKFVKFVTVYRPEQMPMQRAAILPWPYTEGLRLDEAMHPLTILATGMYGKPMPNQDGAPIRLVVPWKYGFKSAKSLAKIELTDTMPDTAWASANPGEYGFYANVNPHVDHPRWSQATERRIGEPGRRSTLMFNGYEKDVASLYQGMDLKENF
ncbi:MAG: protein-methionine-sulfoxide reductase catalytic subunit MsrP [Anaerolineae bacterium]